MNDADLKNLSERIASDPTLAEHAKEGRDADIADALNALIARGEVPLSELNKFADSTAITFRLLAAKESTEVTGQLRAAVNMALKLFDARYDTVSVDDPTFGMICDVLIQATIITKEDKAGLLALADNRMPSIGSFVSSSDVSFALRGAK